MRTVTAAEIQAMREAQEACPNILRAAYLACSHYAARWPNADDLAADAATLVACFIPDHIRQPAEDAAPLADEDADRIAQGAAKRATARALDRRHQDEKRAASLDALAESNPAAVESVINEAQRYGTAGAGSRTPDPAARYATRPADYYAAALTCLTDKSRDAMEEAAAAYLANVEAGHRQTARLPHATKQAGGRSNRAAVETALETLARYATGILTNPHERTPAAVRTQPTARRLEARTLARQDATCADCRTADAHRPHALDAARNAHAAQVARLDAYAAHLASKPNDPDRQGEATDHGRAALDAAHAAQVARIEDRSCTHAERQPATITATTGTLTPAQVEARWTALDMDRYAAAYAAVWTPEPKRPTARWTTKARRLALAYTIDQRTAADARREAAKARLAALPPTAGPLITMTPVDANGYPAALAYGPATGTRVTIDHQPAATLPTIRPDHITPVLTRTEEGWTLDAPATLAATERRARTEQRSAETIATRPGGAVRKPSRRAGNRTGASGPTVPAWW